MTIKHELQEVIKEYVLHVEGLEFTVKGRITLNADADGLQQYQWAISHHYRPSKEAAGVYYPSKLITETKDEAEHLLKLYMKGFSTIDVEPNKYY